MQAIVFSFTMKQIIFNMLDGSLQSQQVKTSSSIVLGFLDPSYQLWRTDVTAFCMQLQSHFLR